MNHLLKILLATVVVALGACGGGGPDAGKSPFGTGDTTTCTSAGASAPATACPTASNLTLNLDSASIQNTGAATVKATATATTTSGQALSGIPISFSVDNGATYTQSSSS